MEARIQLFFQRSNLLTAWIVCFVCGVLLTCEYLWSGFFYVENAQPATLIRSTIASLTISGNQLVLWNPKRSEFVSATIQINAWNHFVAVGGVWQNRDVLVLYVNGTYQDGNYIDDASFPKAIPTISTSVL